VGNRPVADCPLTVVDGALDGIIEAFAEYLGVLTFDFLPRDEGKDAARPAPETPQPRLRKVQRDGA
jgi:hypothetical protein